MSTNSGSDGAFGNASLPEPEAQTEPSEPPTAVAGEELPNLPGDSNRPGG